MAGAYQAYLNARVTIFGQRLLSPAETDRLIVDGAGPGREGESTGNPVHDLYLTLLRSGEEHPEQALLDAILADFLILVRPLTGGDRDFLTFGGRWFEIANLKTLIRGKFSGLPEAEIRAQLLDMGPFTRLPVQELLQAEDPMEMLRRLEQTTYAGIVRQARRVFEEERDQFALDAAIDRFFFTGLSQRANGVSEDERQSLKTVLGAVLDRFNLLWLLRYRFNYGLSPAKTYYLLAATGRRLAAEDLMALARLDTVEAVVAALPPVLRERMEGADTVTEIENRMEAGYLEVARRELFLGSHPVTRCFAWVVLREAEMRHVMAISKGRRLGFRPELIRFAVGAEG